MSEELPVKSEDSREVQRTWLETKYQQLPPEEQVFWYNMEAEFTSAIQLAAIKIGHIFERIKQQTNCQGVRSDLSKGITFKNWVEAHGYSVRQADRLILIARGYDQIMASNDPDKEHMLEVYVALPKNQQELIASGKANAKRASLLLHSREDYRYSANWLAMNEELEHQEEENNQLQNDNQRLNTENAELVRRNAELERQQSENLKQNSVIQEQNRKLTVELEDLRAQGNEPVEVVPSDYDENKQKIAELTAEIEELQAKHHTADEETISQLNSEIARLKQQLASANVSPLEKAQDLINDFCRQLNNIDISLVQDEANKLSDFETSRLDITKLVKTISKKVEEVQVLVTKKNKAGGEDG